MCAMGSHWESSEGVLGSKKDNVPFDVEGRPTPLIKSDHIYIYIIYKANYPGLACFLAMCTF